MNISAITGAYSQQALRKDADALAMRRKSDTPTKSISKPIRDTVEISKAGLDKLSKVRTRIDSGFYNSDTVAESISNKLSDVMDDLTS